MQLLPLLSLIVTKSMFSSVLTTLHYQRILIQLYKVDIIPQFTYENIEFLLEFKQLVQNYISYVFQSLCYMSSHILVDKI